MKVPMLLTQGYLVDPDKPLEEGESVLSHVRVGPSALAVDFHVKNPEGEDGEDVYAVMIPLDALDQLFALAEAFLTDSTSAGLAMPSEPRKDLLN